mgnify:CR=1 FL=1
MRKIKYISLFLISLFGYNLNAQSIRKDISLNSDWLTVANDTNKQAFNGFERKEYQPENWKKVNVPHNWDQYHGYRRELHGNRHGYAWYRKTFKAKDLKKSKRYFLFFEGVGSYATVWLNGKQVGYHAGGRTTFTIDVTNTINLKKENILAVRADHPAHIHDLPWVCGGCSTERGFSEGSQPMGIFRPVHLIETSEVRIEPFGVHAWNDNQISQERARVNFATEVKNYSTKAKTITVVSQLLDKGGKVVSEQRKLENIAPGKLLKVSQQTSPITNPVLWSIENPYLYTVVTSIEEKGKLLDSIHTPYGIRWISWPVARNNNDKRFFLNGKPVFINGIAEYEHLLGQSHAFSDEQVRSRVFQMKAAGFNAFRDAHQPHNLRYQEYWDREGLLLWTQMAAHIWYDTPEFRKNFKELLIDWVKERRNSPSVVLWGLENESTLPEDFARECTELIRSLDPTASSQRLVTTCNGGKGTDWDVPQNWTGTYGGDPKTYAEDMKRQVLIGEYGAWRTLDLHTEGPFNQNGPYSEDRMAQLMEMKVRLAESAKDSTSGHYFWLFTSHDNPGRVQGGEGLRELDRIGPVNYKGLLTPWEEPLDVYYMFRSNYAPKATEPMVYIASHTWPDRWTTTGLKDSITVYSNCDEVELFNDVDNVSLGRKKRGGVGTHFQWDNVNIRYNVLYAKGYVNGKEVAKDYIVLHHLPQSPNFAEFLKDARPATAPETGYKYLYRVNAGGPDYTDENGNTWLADRQQSGSNVWGSNSWTKDFPGTPAFFASQRRTHDPIKGTRDWKLFQDFRYGRDKLNFEFPADDGEYLVELYFVEPWLGTGGGMDCTGMRIFDVALNDKVVLNDLDIWKEVGHDALLKKTVKVKVTGGKLVVSFPEVKSGQAVLSAIAIATENNALEPSSAAPALIQNLSLSTSTVQSWMDTGDKAYLDDEAAFVSLPSNLYGAEWIKTSKGTSSGLSFNTSKEADVFVGYPSGVTAPEWLKNYEETGTTIVSTYNKLQNYAVYRKRFPASEAISLGKSGQSPMYIVAVSPATALEPAHDLKKAVSYKATDAKFIGPGLQKEVLMGRERATFKNASGDILEFTINTGVADVYSLTVKYHNPFPKTLRAKIEVLAADGTLMKKAESFDLTPTKEGKWNYFTTNTGTMINAGTYKVRIIAEDMAGVSVDAVDVQ